MDIKQFMNDPDEKPLDRLVTDGGFCGIFRTIACVGDSLSSGEFEVLRDNGERSYYDLYDYSWGQYLARMAGSKAYNFSRGGMSAREYVEHFAEDSGFWDPALACQAYIIALGVNDFLNSYSTPEEFERCYRQIITRYQAIAPNAKFFLVTIPRDEDGPEAQQKKQTHAQMLYSFAEEFPNCYVLDLYRYGPVDDKAFREAFFYNNHMAPTGYLLTARMIASYIDYIIRTHPDDFREIGLFGIDGF